jgi:hypothetical protein
MRIADEEGNHLPQNPIFVIVGAETT